MTDKNSDLMFVSMTPSRFTFEDFQRRVRLFVERETAFSDSTIHTNANHLREEFSELFELTDAARKSREGAVSHKISEEMCDIIILLFDMANKLGLELDYELANRFNVVSKRDYVANPEKGYAKHV